MASKKTHDAVHVEKYTGRNGEEKKRYTNMGALFSRDDGSLFAKFDSIPVGFSGWVAFYEPRERTDSAPQRQASAPRPSAPAPLDDDGDSIPF